MFTDLLSGLNSLHPIRRLVVMVKDLLPHQCGLLQGLKMRNLISSTSVGTSRRKWEASVVGTFQGLVRLQSLSTPNLKLCPVCSLMKVGDDDDMVKDVTPHFRFSYGKGVVFDEGLYEIDEN